MRSRGNTVRIGIERALRVLTLLVLAFAAWNATRPSSEGGLQTAGNAELGESLARWTAAAPQRVHVSLDVAPSGEERDWLRALRRAGTPVTWRGPEIPALALEVAPVADPRGGMMLWIVAPSGARVAVADAIAPIDTVVTRAGGAMVLAPVTSGRLTAAVGAQRATASARDSILPRHVLVLGRATWEAKFVITALEESGWTVDARLAIAPGVDVTQGAPRSPDTARHAAVVVLDAPSGAATSAIARYVRSGGGAIIGGAAASDGALATVAAGRTGRRTRPSSIAFADDAPRHALAFLAIVPRADAIALEERDGRVAVAGRRVEVGRVVQLGYDETWRWRLGGGAQAVDAHRAWWSALVSSVARRAVGALPRDPRDDDAPLARLVDALGVPSASAGSMAAGARWVPSPVLLFALVGASLLAELASRRLRGAP
jgi:hypothetical protein